MYCNRCGAQQPDGSRFCNNCGATFTIDWKDDTTPHMQSSIKKKSRWFLKLFAFILVAAIALVGWFLSSLDLYVYSKMTIHSKSDVSIQDQLELDSYFSGTYLYDADDDYHIIDLESGLEGLGRDLSEMSGELINTSIECGEKYAYFELSDPSSSDSITFTYYKANLFERLYFASRYFSWK